MKSREEIANDMLNQDLGITPACEMVNLLPAATGLKVKVWVDAGANRRNIQHSVYRVKLMKDSRVVVISFRKGYPITVEEPKGLTPKDVKDFDVTLAFKWIEANEGYLYMLYDNNDGKGNPYTIEDFKKDMIKV